MNKETMSTGRWDSEMAGSALRTHGAMWRKGKEGKFLSGTEGVYNRWGIGLMLYESCSPGRENNIHNKVEEEKSTVVGVGRLGSAELDEA